METEITDNKDHFVRNHGGIPEINAEEYTLDIEGLVNDPKRLTLADLQNEELFPRQSNVVSLQCSGTRRIEQINEYPGDGDELINAPWGEGAIGTARWTGVSLKKIIKHCGGLKDGGKDVHLEFYGADTYFKKGKVMNYVVSVPWRKVKINEVLLAWEMNGEPLPKIHGFPLRAVVFGCKSKAPTILMRLRIRLTDANPRHWSQKLQMALQDQSYQRPQSRACPIEGVPLLHTPGRQAKRNVQQRLQYPRHARLFGHHVPGQHGPNRPRRQDKDARLGLLWWWSLARTR